VAEVRAAELLESESFRLKASTAGGEQVDAGNQEKLLEDGVHSEILSPMRLG
jgi:hypothetical protein